MPLAHCVSLRLAEGSAHAPRGVLIRWRLPQPLWPWPSQPERHLPIGIAVGMAKSSSSNCAAKSAKPKSKAKAKAESVRALKRRTTDAQAARALADHCPGWSNADLTKEVNGKTLYAQVKDDIRASRTDNRKLGSRYWAMMRMRYSQTMTSATSLQVASATDALSPALRAACELVYTDNSQKRTYNALKRYFEEVQSLSQREVVVSLRAVLDPQCMVRKGGVRTIIECMRAFVRVGAHTQYANETAVAKTTFDQALAQHIGQMKKAGVDLKTFWTIREMHLGI